MRVYYTSIFRRSTLVALVVALVGSVMQVTPVYAASIVVNSNADTIANDGACTLREALIAAQQDAPTGGCAGGSGTDTITFAGNYTITVGNELPTVTTSITITGNGAANTIIQASTCNPITLPGGCIPATWRVFQVSQTGNLTLDQVTVRHGNCNGSCSVLGDITNSNAGGGIYNSGTLTVTNSTILGNHAVAGGGAIFNKGTLTARNSTFLNNRATLPNDASGSWGGAIFNHGTLTLTNSTFSENYGESGGGIYNEGVLTVTNNTFSGNSAQRGAGIFNLGTMAVVINSTFSRNTAESGFGGGIENSGTLGVMNSTFLGNSANGGGGVFNEGLLAVDSSTFSGNTAGGGGGIENGGSLTVTNSTLSGNIASDIGGGIFNLGTLTVTNSTLSGNTAANTGGGIFHDLINTSTTLKNTIVANNGGGNCAAISGSIVNGGGNLDSGTTCGWDSNNASLSNKDPKLGPLANNGGHTKTMALLLGSPAIDSGTDGNCPSTDQREGARPQGSHCDIGAYEFGAAVTFIPTFADVPQSYWAWDFIERLYAAGITGGCATSPLQYCPEGTVTRAQMAVFLLRGIHGASYAPPGVSGGTGFGDVPPTYWAATFIKQLAAEGITTGCGNGNYCPEGAVTRGQMAIFLLRSKHGAAYTPPGVGASTGFGDVPPDYWAAAFIKQLVTEGITAGCGGGNYCPEQPVTRAQMAVFLVRTFSLP